ncbi:mesothelin isoform X2 [Orcinus orca]|uniref:mesothelin isoform X2 n=1 Tax=Orcinus orca TaxID=9733 RepID=UPI002112109C|nr:mesothelin isoform X2 [Orcinus orca]
MQPTFFTWLRTQPKSPEGRRVRRDAQCLLKREENGSDGEGEPFLPRLRLSAEPWGSRRESAVISKTSLRKLQFPVRFYYLRQNRCWLDSVLESSCTGWVLLSRAQAADTELGVMTPWLQWDLSWQRPEVTVILLRAQRCTEKKACPPGRKAQVLDENLVFYEEWELEACVDGALLAAQMDQVNLVPFTYQQLHIFKRKLDEGYPESLIQHLRYFFLWVTPEDIHKWNVTSLETVKSLLKVSKGHGMDARVTGCGGGRPHCPLCRGRGPAGQGHTGHPGHLPRYLPVPPQP